jgi:hypothetical protein
MYKRWVKTMAQNITGKVKVMITKNGATIYMKITRCQWRRHVHRGRGKCPTLADEILKIHFYFYIFFRKKGKNISKVKNNYEIMHHLRIFPYPICYIVKSNIVLGQRPYFFLSPCI